MQSNSILFFGSAILFLTILFQQQQLLQVACETDIDEIPGFHLKRSLCNTFGGCGSKRSFQAGTSMNSNHQQEQTTNGAGSSSNIIHPEPEIDENKAILITKILNDLVQK